MKKSIGGAMLFNILIIFLVVVFAILAGTLSYTKAYRMNSKIINALERYEGHNGPAKEEINKILGAMGYLQGSTKCPDRKVKDGSGTIVTLSAESGDRYQYCVYLFDNDTAGFDEDRRYYSYEVMTYMTLNLPIVGAIRIPIFGKTNRIYRFGV